MSDIVTSNKRRSVALVAGLIIVVAIVGALIGWLAGSIIFGVIIAVVVAAAYAVGAYRLADSIALRVGRAEPADAGDHPRLYNLVEGLCMSSGVPLPDLYIVNDAAPNAFAVGRTPNHAAIAVTTGLLDGLERVELEGVVAQQIAKIKNYDTLVSALAVTIIAPVALASDLLLRSRWWNGGRVARPGDPEPTNSPVAYLGVALQVFSPLAGWLMRRSILASRETLADVSACQLTRYPPGLIDALEKLNKDVTVTHSATTATAHLWLGQPLSGIGDSGELESSHQRFDTHPPLEERIALLREL